MTEKGPFDAITRPGGNVVSNDPRIPEKIRNLNLGAILWKLTNEDSEAANEVDWTEAQVLRVIEEYRKFLTLTLEGQGKITSPSHNIDVIWHHHILDTKKYYEDMIDIFGHMIHHFPYLGVRGSADRQILLDGYEDTLKRYETRFGTVPKDVWGEAAHCGSSHCSSIGNGSGGNNSDWKLKFDIKSIDNILSELLYLKPRSYYFKTEEYPTMKLPNYRQYGLIAQEVEKVIPDLVYNSLSGGIEHKAVNYQGLITLILQGLKEQNQLAVSLEQKVEDLQKELDHLKVH